MHAQVYMLTHKNTDVKIEKKITVILIVAFVIETSVCNE